MMHRGSEMDHTPSSKSAISYILLYFNRSTMHRRTEMDHTPSPREGLHYILLSFIGSMIYRGIWKVPSQRQIDHTICTMLLGVRCIADPMWTIRPTHCEMRGHWEAVVLHTFFCVFSMTLCCIVAYAYDVALHRTYCTARSIDYEGHSHNDRVVPRISSTIIFLYFEVCCITNSGVAPHWLPATTLVSLPQPYMYTRIICVIMLFCCGVTPLQASKTPVSCGRGLIRRVVQECGHTRGDRTVRPRPKRAPASSWGNALTRLERLGCNPVGCTHQRVTLVCQAVREGILNCQFGELKQGVMQWGSRVASIKFWTPELH